MSTNYDYKILKKHSATEGRVLMKKVLEPKVQYATEEYVDEKIDQLRIEMNDGFTRLEKLILSQNKK
jgi:hypothetical protein